MYTFAQPLSRALSIAAGSTAVACQDHRRTYAELGSRCRRLAGAMRKLGLAPGDRVGVVALNSDRYLELYLGLPAAGYVLVPVNSRLAPAEMRAILADAGVGVVFTDAGYPGTADVSQVLTMPGDYEDLIAAADEVPLGAGVTENDLAALFYTSGTTGAAKGAMHTHRSLVSSALHFMATWPLVDRAKDMIVSGGENIYSTEVEDALGSHPAVEEVAVFGVPDPRWGETVYAVVFSRTPVTADDLVAQCRGRIAGFKVPKSIELRTEPLPKSAAGKILKRELRDPHWAGQQAQVSGG
jgi:acyl-CoA synthetase (AMP-forming)/AMP-acid ligase II